MQLPNASDRQPDEHGYADRQEKRQENDVGRWCRLGEEELGVTAEETEQWLGHGDHKEDHR